MKTDHIDAANAAVDTAIERLMDMASLNRQQADGAEIGAGVLRTLMTGVLTPEGKKDIADLAARFSRQPEAKPDYSGGKRPASAVVPARTVANGTDKPAGQVAAE
jgi:hypothetical protein